MKFATRSTQGWNQVSLCGWGKRTETWVTCPIKVWPQHPLVAHLPRVFNFTGCLLLCSPPSLPWVLPGPIVLCGPLQINKHLKNYFTTLHCVLYARIQPLAYLGFVPAWCKATSKQLPWEPVGDSSLPMSPRDREATGSAVWDGFRGGVPAVIQRRHGA